MLSIFPVTFTPFSCNYSAYSLYHFVSPFIFRVFRPFFHCFDDIRCDSMLRDGFLPFTLYFFFAWILHAEFTWCDWGDNNETMRYAFTNVWRTHADNDTYSRRVSISVLMFRSIYVYAEVPLFLHLIKQKNIAFPEKWLRFTK